MMMLLDKGYFDYDYQKTERQHVVTWEETVKSDEEIRGILAGFGIGRPKKEKPQTLEEIQNYIRETEQWQ